MTEWVWDEEGALVDIAPHALDVGDEIVASPERRVSHSAILVAGA